MIESPTLKKVVDKLLSEAISVKFIAFMIACRFVIDSVIDAQTWMIFSLGVLGIREYSKIQTKKMQGGVPNETVEDI